MTYDHPLVVGLINALCKGALGLMFNHFLPTHKLASKQRAGTRVTRRYGAARTPDARLLAIEDFDPATKLRLRALHQQHNPFQLRRDIERQFKEIESVRLLGSCQIHPAWRPSAHPNQRRRRNVPRPLRSCLPSFPTEGVNHRATPHGSSGLLPTPPG